jgi:hypothetical protein
MDHLLKVVTYRKITSVNALTSYGLESYAPAKHLPRRSPYLSKALTNFPLAMYESQLVDKADTSDGNDSLIVGREGDCASKACGQFWRRVRCTYGDEQSLQVQHEST